MSKPESLLELENSVCFHANAKGFQRRPYTFHGKVRGENVWGIYWKNAGGEEYERSVVMSGMTTVSIETEKRAILLEALKVLSES